ncbi:MAG: 23S rRNA (uracil(1939)-C(5))-methyltransferase RlmD [Deltaproteobacteria bacterium]|nr:23S rRNA (uracil(1939)-C(5))-methyltransferase RlmD [Deltaproteobacteria bacterium]
MKPNTTPRAGKPEKGERLQLRVERMAALGRGVSHRDGFTILVSRCLPGELVEAEVESVHSRHALARAISVPEPVLNRESPPCPHYEGCGGCDFQHMGYSSQLETKRRVFTEQLQRLGKVEAPSGWTVRPAEKPWEYRDKLDFTPVWTDGGLRPAFHGPDGQSLTPVERCHLAPEEYSLAALATLEALSDSGAAPAAKTGTLKRLSVHGTAGGLALLLTLDSRNALEALRENSEHFLSRLLAKAPQVVQVSLSSPRSRRGGMERAHLLGGEWLKKQIGELDYLTPVAGFFQVNPQQAELLAGYVTEAVTSHYDQLRLKNSGTEGAGTVFDLYCGVGLFTLQMALQGLPVVGVEMDAGAVRAAEENLRELIAAKRIPRARGGGHCVFERRNMEQPEVFPRLVKRYGTPGIVVVDPPRRGLSAELCQALLDSGPSLIAYVSCDGGTFSRDAARLAPRYRLDSLRGFDLFPQTHHLELAGLFRLRSE